MTDYELSNYLPVHGDRLRLRKHLKQEPGKKKRQLLQILQEKLNKAKKGKKKKDNTSSAEEEEEDMRRYHACVETGERCILRTPKNVILSH